MAADANKFLLHFCFVFSIFVLNTSHGAHVMQRENSCGDIEGTWSIRPNKISNVTAYFLLKKDKSLLKLQSAAEKFADLLPFKSVVGKSDNQFLTAVHVQLRHLLGAVEETTSSRNDDNCSFTLKSGHILTKEATVNHVHVIYMNHLEI